MNNIIKINDNVIFLKERDWFFKENEWKIINLERTLKLDITNKQLIKRLDDILELNNELTHEESIEYILVALLNIVERMNNNE
jgi:hypothetical protein